jgi:hypothetical protein
VLEHCSGSFIPDLVVIVDETAAVHSKKTLVSLQVLCTQEAQQAATRAKKSIDEHVTLCCGMFLRRDDKQSPYLSSKTRQSLPKQPCLVVALTTASTASNTVQMVDKIQ